MSQPLGSAIGNALDVREAVEVLRGDRVGRLRDLAVRFAGAAAARLLHLDDVEGARRAAAALDDGSALEAFRRMVERQGGDPAVVDDPARVLPAAPHVVPILADATGTLARVEAESIGRASADLGAGRHRKGDPVDPAVGILFEISIGDPVVAGARIGEVHARRVDDAEEAVRRVLAALTVVDGPVAPPALVHAWIDR